MNPSSRETDRVGLIVFLAAIIFTPILVLFAPIWMLPLTLLGFAVLHFGGHAQMHRTLVVPRSRAAHVLHSVLMFIGFGVQLLNPHLMTAAHLNHHRVGRIDSNAFDQADGEGLFSRPIYLAGLLGGVYVYWALRGMVHHNDLRDKARLSRGDFRTFIYTAASNVISLGLITAGIWLNVLHFCAAYLVFGVWWSLNQNVAHVGLDGWSHYSKRVAARTYRTFALGELLTFGSLNHLAHHMFPKANRIALSQRMYEDEAQQILRRSIVTRGGLAAYFRDLYALQLTRCGKVKAEDAEWVTLSPLN